ncbi:D-arabinono-1,4-lactone oxidase [Propioniciclava soli]|uniref:D-arabinono-1,4-lactone oxidase n=1 Tax=Propioniciclava soli TaxID=2775081 RepID=A0ABZ3CB09_9ACTN
MRWSNWADTSSVCGIEVAEPAATAEVSALLREASEHGRRVRPIGAGHSFSAVARPVDLAVDLRRLCGVRVIADGGGRVRVGAGIVLGDLNAALAAHGLALPNLGDIDRQRLAGALATGTHGTGGRLHGLASAVTGLTLVTPDGQIHATAPGDGLFEAARISLGALGVVTEVELATVPAFRLRAEEGPEPLDAVLADVDAFVASADHAEFFWFPHTRVASTRRNHRVDDGGGRPLPRWQSHLSDHLLGNRAYELVNRVGAARPGWVPALNRLSAATLGRRTYTDASAQVFCSERSVRFAESEYALPRAAVVPALRDLRAWFDRTRAAVTFPLEVRFLAADDVWLSGAQGRATAYVACHQHVRGGFADVFAAFETIMAAYDGRPHWGKLHTVDAARLAELHPHFEDFLAVRERCDPARVLTNPHLERILGP